MQADANTKIQIRLNNWSKLNNKPATPKQTSCSPALANGCSQKNQAEIVKAKITLIPFGIAKNQIKCELNFEGNN